MGSRGRSPLDNFLEDLSLANRAPSGSGQPRVAVCLYDLSLWILKRTNRFPRNYRITLGDRLDTQILCMLALVQRASLRREKIALLEQINEELNVFRSLLRLSVDLECLQSSQYEHVSKQIEEIGRQIGGWVKQQRRGEE